MKREKNMKMRKIPLRKCIGCGEQKDKRDLLRIVRTKEGEVFFDPTGKHNGRGAYLCRDSACLEKAFKQKSLQRSFKSALSPEVMDELRQSLEE